MQFIKIDNVYTIIRMRVNQDSFLGVVFAENNEKNIELIELYVSNPKKNKIQPSLDEVLKQVLFGLKSVNESLELNARVSKVYLFL